MKKLIKLSRLMRVPYPFMIVLGISLICITPLTATIDSKQIPPVLNSLVGDIWVETDGNTIYNGEPGPSGVLVQLYDNNVDTLVAETISAFGKYEFSGINPGTYYLKIDQSAFQPGGALINLQSCPGANDANDMTDNDDNGSDTTPFDVFSSPFVLSNTDPNSEITVEYIDFCFSASCNGPNPYAAPTCEEIASSQILCHVSDLNNLCATMPEDSTGGNQPSPLCDGFSVAQNISWFAFIADDGDYTITLSPMNCTFGNLSQQGLQVGLYKDCSFEESVFCSDCTEDPISISSDLLVPGQVYYAYVNGCSGNICSYSVSVNGSPATPSLMPDDVCIFDNGSFICDNISYCPNTDIRIQARGVPISGTFAWKISTLSGPEYPNDPSPNTGSNELLINVPTNGEYEVCITQISNGCTDQQWTGSICTVLTIDSSIPQPADEDFGPFFVCPGEESTFSVTTFAGQDPNGDGTFGWQAPLPQIQIGATIGTAYVEGCAYEQQFSLDTFPSSPIEDVTVTVCDYDLPVVIDGLVFTSFGFNGNTTIELGEITLQETENSNGCDSIINLTVERLIVLQGGILPPVCTEEGFVLEFNYIELLSTEVEFLTFLWSDPLGNLLPSGNDPLTVVAPFESGNGEYSLEVIANKNGTTCSFMYTVFIDVNTYLPPIPIVTGPSMVCDGEVVEYTALGDGTESNFNWTFPNDVASAVLSGQTNEIITIDWTGSAGGDLSVFGQNTCGFSNPTSYEVNVTPKSTPNFSLDTSTCINNVVLINYQGSNLNIDSYLWDFDGGTIESGSGIGPYEISWNSEGTKTVSLTTIDTDGCTSNTTTKTILVKTPLSPTNVTCVPFVGEVTFTWDIPIGVDGFQVNVLSGQSGGVFSANSFTIDGLDEGEEVTIELLTIPNDQTCGEFVSTIASCTALDCSPPEIVLEAPQNVCQDGGNITITAEITSGEMGLGTFSGPGIIDSIAGVFDPTQANIGANTILYLFTSDVADCQGSKTISIEVFEVPTASFTQNVDTMCISETLMLDYTGTPNAEVFNWNFDGGIGSGLITDQNVVFDTPGLKTISLQVIKDGCVSNMATSSVLVEPELEMIEITCDTVGPDFIVFSWNPVQGAAFYEIQIDNNAPFFNSDTQITLDGLMEEQLVNISISSISATSCPGNTSLSSCMTTKLPVSVNDEWADNIRIYPNPVEETLLVEGVSVEGFTYKLCSITGAEVKKGYLGSGRINMASLPPGVYILSVYEHSSGSVKSFNVIRK